MLPYSHDKRVAKAFQAVLPFKVWDFVHALLKKPEVQDSWCHNVNTSGKTHWIPLCLPYSYKLMGLSLFCKCSWLSSVLCTLSVGKSLNSDTEHLSWLLCLNLPLWLVSLVSFLILHKSSPVWKIEKYSLEIQEGIKAKLYVEHINMIK